MTTTDTTPAADRPLADLDHYAHHGRAGSAARMAVLEQLAQLPGGAAFHQVASAIAAKLGRQLPDKRVLQVLMSLRADQLVAREGRKGPGGLVESLWFSPASRQAALARGTWRRGITEPTTAQQPPADPADDATVAALSAALLLAPAAAPAADAD